MDTRNAGSGVPCQNSNVSEVAEEITAKDSFAIKVHQINEPIVGIYVAQEQARFSPLFVIQLETGNQIKVLGNKDLTSKMNQIQIGEKVSIEYAGHRQTNSGYIMHFVTLKRFMSVADAPSIPTPQTFNE